MNIAKFFSSRIFYLLVIGFAGAFTVITVVTVSLVADPKESEPEVTTISVEETTMTSTESSTTEQTETSTEPQDTSSTEPGETSSTDATETFRSLSRHKSFET